LNEHRRPILHHKNATMRRFIAKSHETIGNAMAPKMECADKYGEQIRELPGLSPWGYRARTCAARSLKHSPCRVDEKSVHNAAI
jgi:hypothetical protein